ncbi:MAG: hypothetical protein ABSG76_06725 [Xanthobacteraceae bacterium]|jgi:hypothetical protein
MRRVGIAAVAVLAIWGVAQLASAADLALISPPPRHDRPVVEQHPRREAPGSTTPAQHEVLLSRFLRWMKGDSGAR